MIEIMEAFIAKRDENSEGESPSPLKKILSIFLKTIQFLGEKKTWSFEKVVTEFRKLFDDKTTFMNLYNNGSILGKSTMSLVY